MEAKARKTESIRGAVPLSHFFLQHRVLAGDSVLDATCGNGNDTLLLAGLVGEGGKVWAFDIQPRAIAATKTILKRKGLLSSVELIEACHERITEFVPPGLKAAVFNLGYLPGGDDPLTTSAVTTVNALEQTASLLVPGGIITIALYTGHDGGPEEAQAVEHWGAALPPNKFNVWSSRQLNRPPIAPYLILIERI